MPQEFKSTLDIAALSDEEFSSLELEDFSHLDAPQEESEDIPEEDVGEEESDDQEEQLEDGSDEEQEYGEEESDIADEDSETDQEADDTSEDETTEEDEAEEDTTNTDLEKLYAPFKAAGTEMQVSNVDEAISLMKKGVDYNRKMQQMKPHLRTVRMLEKENLLDDAKLSLLIDASKGDPGAISKLMQEHNIDSLDVDEDKAKQYSPNTYTVDDKEIALSDVMENIRGTESYNRTIDIVGNKWDQTSRDFITETPEILNTINDHITLGYFDKISAEVEKGRLLGKIPTGMSDLEAYNATLQLLQDAEKKATQSNVVKKAAKQPTNTDPELRSRKKSSVPPRSKKAPPPQRVPTSKEAAAMSDEDFLKMMERIQ